MRAIPSQQRTMATHSSHTLLGHPHRHGHCVAKAGYTMAAGVLVQTVAALHNTGFTQAACA